jgi:Protein of unknown function (DUF3108)
LSWVTDPLPQPNRFRGMPSLFSPVLVASPLSSADLTPFQTGETLKYRISWSNFVEAGTAELSVGPGDQMIANSYRLQLKASSTPPISSLYVFKDEFVSLFDGGIAAPIRFEKNFIEKKRQVKETLAFDQINRSATLEVHGQSYRIPIEVGTQDPLSALYAVRGLVMRPGLQVSLPVLDGGRIFQLDIRVTGSDLISTSLGSFNTHRVEAGLRRDGVSLSDKRMTIWLTNDTRKVPVLASVSLSVGSALIELISQSN